MTSLYPVRESRVEESDSSFIWENPDVPPIEDILSGKVEEIECPYPDNSCDPAKVKLKSDDPDENFEKFVEILEDQDGTHRCGDCNEPLYGIRGDGDH